MANPQVEDGFIRIANELWDEILRRDFTKRQQNLILFIWRLSYGTGQKDCIIPNFNLFEIAGIYKTDIKKELNYLRDCSVLNWDEESMTFSVNKHHKEWQISPKKNWDNDKFNGLIHSNLERKKVSKTLTKENEKEKKVSKTLTELDPKVSETLTDSMRKVSKILTHTDVKVSKTLTLKLVKYQPRRPLNAVISRDTGSLNTVLKTINIKDNKDINNNNNAHVFFEQNIAPLNPYVIDQITDWLEIFPEDVVIFSMQLAVEANKRSMSYINAVLTNWKNEGVKNLADAKRSNYEFRNRFKRNQGKGNNENLEIIPDWFIKQKQERKTSRQKTEIIDEELEAMLKRHASDGG